jgi:phosphatidylglycerophosphatase A
MNKPAAWIATWFGCGYFPVGPGTAGSAAAVAIALAAHWRWHFAPFWLVVPALVLVFPGIWAAGVVAKNLQMEDPGLVVVDEVIGQWITLAGATTLNWKSWLGGFLLFRLFDIWKPFPVRQLEALPGGAGIVADDVMAGLYGALVLFAAGCFNLY